MMNQGPMRVWRFEMYDISKDEYVTSSRWGAQHFIEAIKARRIEGETWLDPKYLIDQNATAKGFDIEKPQMPLRDDKI